MPRTGFSNGDLRSDIGVTSKDETGLPQAAMKRMVEKLREVVYDIKMAAASDRSNSHRARPSKLNRRKRHLRQ